jgi:peptidoglycan/LPS O-acetylase OafA/YrhL
MQNILKKNNSSTECQSKAAISKNSFDFLRYLFAFIVVLAHLIDLTGVPEIKFLKKYIDSQLAVAGFFIISGHLIYPSLLRSSTLTSYYTKRAKRLLPAYILFVILAVTLLSLISSLPFHMYWKNGGLIKYILANLSFMNFLYPCLPGVFENNSLCAVNGALWTIKIEIGFYLVLPILAWLINKFQSKTRFYLLLYGLGLFYKSSIWILSSIMSEKAQLFELLNHQLPAYFMYFGAGMFLYDFKVQLQKLPKNIYFIALLDCLIEYGLKLEIGFPLAFAVLIIAFANNSSFLNNWGKHGDFSYGIYLFHFPLIQTAVQLGYFNQYPFYIVSILILIAVNFWAILSWHLIEKRFLQTR